jgi:Tat protein secretion system quality control protein TatD with DNase activity
MLITNEKNQKTFRELNIQSIFLETDDQSKYSIEEIYDVAAKIKGIKKSDLKDQMERKFNKLFIESN